MTKNNQTGEQIAPNIKNLPLTEYFKSLPKAQRIPMIISSPKEELIRKIAHLTGREPHSVRRWMYEYCKPGPLERKTIAEVLGCPVECLFPNEEEVAI